jgi:hypothetical protein
LVVNGAQELPSIHSHAAMAAITMTAAEMASMVAEAVRVALAAMRQEEGQVRGEEEGGRGKGSGSGRRLLDLKSFSNVASFNGQEGEWAEWSFGFGVTLSASHAGLGKLAKELVKMPEEKAYPELAMHDFKFQDGADIHWDFEKMSKEFYEVLAVKCQGEALKVVRGIEDQDGFVAWHRLHARFNPKTMARSMMKMERPSLQAMSKTLRTWRKKWLHGKKQSETSIRIIMRKSRTRCGWPYSQQCAIRACRTSSTRRWMP